MIINAKSETDLSGYYIVYDVGANIEYAGVLGISHFIEHLMCKKITDIEEEMKGDGVYFNAYTRNYLVEFLITGLDKYVQKYINKVTNIVLKGDFSEEEFKIEKKIVLEEYTNNFTSQEQAHCCNIYRKLYDIYNPIGLRRDIENLSYEDCKNYHKKIFSKPSRIVNISKYHTYDIDMDFREENLEIARDIVKKKYELVNKFEDKSSIMNLLPVNSNFNEIQIVCEMLGRGMTSPLYSELREKRGLVYAVWCYLNRYDDNNGFLSIDGITSDSNVEIFQDTLKEIFDNKEKYLPQKRLDIIKSALIIEREKQNINLYNNVDLLITPSNWDLFKVLDDLTLNDVYGICDRYFNFENFYHSIDKTEDWS